KIYPYTNNGYGYASPLFYCDLFLYPFAILYYMGMPLVKCYKFVLVVYSFLSTCSIFYVLKKIFNNSKIAPYAGTILYVFCNYHLYDLYIRSALGELFALIFIPLVLYAIYKVLVLHKDSWVLLGVSFAFLLMSHLISFVLYCILFAILIIFFVAFNIHDLSLIKKSAVTVIKAIILAMLLSAWYLLPMIEQMLDQEFWVNKLSEIYSLENNIASISSMYNPFTVLEDDRYSVIGVINIGLVLVVGQYLYIFVKKNGIISILFILSNIIILMMIGIIPIYKLDCLSFIQFTFRLYLLLYPLLVFVLVYTLDKLNLKLGLVIVCLVMLYSVINLGVMNNSLRNCPDYYFLNNYTTRETIYDFTSISKDYNSTEISGAEYLPFNTINDYLRETTFIKQINVDGRYEDIIYEYDRSFTNISFTYNSDAEKLVMLPLSYYKGYQAYVLDGDDRVKLDTINVEKYKKVGFNVLEGEHTYICRYDGTLIQNASMFVSLATVLVLIIKGKKYIND
ncbi:MAG: hypothetical protein ACI4P1_04480, partial [Erysipelotrichaceae bacterium]